MTFIMFITQKDTKRYCFGSEELEFANIYKENYSVVIELENEDVSYGECFEIKCGTSLIMGNVYDRVCDALIRHSNIIDLRGIKCEVGVNLDGTWEELL